MKITNLKVFNFEGALRGMRNPMNSWGKSDSIFDNFQTPIIGQNDLALCQKLINAGSEHRKFMRQILVSFDLTAPLYIWKEFDTYKVGTTANSTSTMHKIMEHPFEEADFEDDDFENVVLDDNDEDNLVLMQDIWEYMYKVLNRLRELYLETKDKRYWKELIRVLPESYLQTRTITLSYENLYSIVRQRKGHKLTEWKTFIDTIKTLPYAEELIFYKY